LPHRADSRARAAICAAAGFYETILPWKTDPSKWRTALAPFEGSDVPQLFPVLRSQRRAVGLLKVAEDHKDRRSLNSGAATSGTA
jgi:hypothetical protein